MPMDPAATTIVTGFDDVPRFAQGLVRDIRIRWALEEIDRPYRTRLFSAMQPRPEGYRAWQPFDQVPAFEDEEVRLFESGAILLYLGEQDARLLPRDRQARWDATAWLIAMLNSVEPRVMQLVNLDIFEAGESWSRDARPGAIEAVSSRLGQVAEALGERDWLAGRFTVADIMMVTVLRNLRHSEIAAGFPTLSAYQRRGEARPAFRQALADQLADFAAREAAGAGARERKDEAKMPQ